MKSVKWGGVCMGVVHTQYYEKVYMATPTGANKTSKHVHPTIKTTETFLYHRWKEEEKKQPLTHASCFVYYYTVLLPPPPPPLQSIIYTYTTTYMVAMTTTAIYERSCWRGYLHSWIWREGILPSPRGLSQNATFSFWSAELNVTQLKKDDGDMSLRRHSSILCF
jgi:hypothetical protein